MYEIHIRGVVTDDLLDELGGLHVVVESPHTVLCGRVRDQAALHGILRRLENLGIELVELRVFPEDVRVEESRP